MPKRRTTRTTAQTLPPEAYVARRAGIVAERIGEILFVRGPRLRVSLNQTASILWSLCDGQRRVEEIATLLAEQYPEQAERVRLDVLETLEGLRAARLLRLGPTKDPLRPLVRVAFAHTWRGFDRRQNYFVRALSHRLDVILVEAMEEAPDLLFFSSYPDADCDHRRADRSQTRKIFFAGTKVEPDFEQCDLAFSAADAPERFAARHVRLPLWALYLDWETFRASASAVNDGQIPIELRPPAIGDRLFALLFEEPASDRSSSPDPHDSSEPSARSPAPPTGDEERGTRNVTASDRKLTLGMATYDDYDGVYFTVQALRLYHPELADELEIVIVDNHPDGPAAQALRDLAMGSPHYRYVANRERQGTATRDLVFREARTPYVVCVDSHVLIAPGAIRRLIDYLDAHPQCLDLLQGPLAYDDQSRFATHFAEVWSTGMYGTWAMDERGADPDAAPFEIPMQGLGLFACRRDAWLGFNSRFTGFGGEEGYIHKKFRRAGRRTLCLPFLRWNHRFQRPLGIRYANIWEERIRNYVIGWHELGEDTGALEAHFRQELGEDVLERAMAQIRAEIDGPFHLFDAIYCINLDAAVDRWQAMEERFRRLGILHRVRRFAAIETPESHHIGCALSHRRILEQARREGLANVLVFEDDALIRDDAVPALKRSVDELRSLPWLVLHFGGQRFDTDFSLAARCEHLEVCDDLTASEAVAYNAPVFDRLLSALPADRTEMRLWLETEKGIDQYLRNVSPRYLTRPAVTSVRERLREEPAGVAHRFT